MDVLVTGASSQIGKFLLPKLLQQGYSIICVSRYKKTSQVSEIQWVEGDLTKSMNLVWQRNKPSIWIHLAFLPMAIHHLEAARNAGIKRFICFSSTSIFTKKSSESSYEKRMIQQLIDAEKKLQIVAHKYDISWTIFRPTMIYGCGMDKNITFIQDFIRKFGVFPIAGKACGLRQPVHAEDLAIACIQILTLDNTKNKAYNLSGGEVLTYREIVKRLFEAENRPVRIISIYPIIFKCMLHVVKRIIPRYAFIQTTMIDRMNMDMVFDFSDASRDFNYTPRFFQLY